MRNISLILFLALTTQPALAQGFAEAGGARAFSAGLGAGLAGALDHGRVVQQSYDALVEAQQMAVARNQQIQTYFKQAMQYEKNKQWNYAETALTYVLRLIARRDGPGSPNSIPVLSHLSKVCQSQKNLVQAIDYQKTVVALTQAERKVDPRAILTEQHTLSTLYVQNKDYDNAKSALRAEVALFDKYPELPHEQYAVTMSVYGTVLHELHQDAQLPQAATAPPAQPATPPAQATATVPAVTTTASAQATAAKAGQPYTASATLSLPAKDEPLTKEQRALQNAHLIGSEPLPSELEMVRSLTSGEHLTPAQESIVKSNVPGLQSATLQKNTGAGQPDLKQTPPPSSSPGGTFAEPAKASSDGR